MESICHTHIKIQSLTLFGYSDSKKICQKQTFSLSYISEIQRVFIDVYQYSQSGLNPDTRLTRNRHWIGAIR